MTEKELREAMVAGLSCLEYSSEQTDRLFQQLQRKPSVRRKPIIVFVCIMILIIATAALALTNSLGTLSALFHIRHRDGAEMEMVTTEMIQSGGELKHATFFARDAFFDGRVVRVAVEHTPTTDNTVAVWLGTLDSLDPAYADIMVDEVFEVDSSRIEEALQYGGNIVGTDIWLVEASDENGNPVDFYQHSWATKLRDGRSELDVFGSLLSPKPPVEKVRLVFEVRTGLPNGDGSYVKYSESGTFIVEIPKTIDTDIITFPAEAEYGDLHISNVTIRYTPYEMGLFIDVESLENSYIPEDFIEFFSEDKQPLRAECGAINNNLDGGMYSYSILEATDNLPTVIYAQRYGAETAIMIDTLNKSVEIVPSPKAD